ncbi:MAG: hypothetical protein IT167_28335 [Bryobacterales bacterium]|nr:hypothetical protein [Bryobacterales bacterium]
MKKQAFFALLPLSLLAAGFWEKKPYTDWTDKEVARIFTNSPWAKDAAMTMEGGRGGGGMGGGRGGRGGGMGGPGGGMGSAGGGLGGGEGAEGGGGMGGGRGGRGGGMGGGMEGGGGPPQMMARVRWQTALPIKQALVRMRFGTEAATSAQAKELLAREETHYLIALDNLPSMMARLDPSRMQQGLKTTTTLQVKGKDPLRAEDIQIGKTEKSIIIYFLFPKTSPITLEDKEVEFHTKIGPMEVKLRFKLHDMLYAGKLEL